MCFPPVFKGESRAKYVKRCINMNTIAAKYPNRKMKMRHAYYSPGKTFYLTDAARYLGVSKETLRNWEYKGYLKPGFIKHRGRRFRVYQKDILDKIKEVRNEAIAEKQKSNRD